MADDASQVDRFLEWVRSFFRSEDEDAPPPPVEPSGAGEGAPVVDCVKLMDYIARYGRTGGVSLYVREMQHKAGGAGFMSGGWIGALIGAGVGTGRGAAAVRQCREADPAAYDAVVDTHRQVFDAIDGQHKACKARCDSQFENHSIIGPGGKPWRECRKACNDQAQADRRAARGDHGPAGGQWARSILLP